MRVDYESRGSLELYLCFNIKYYVNIPLYDHGQKQLDSLVFFIYYVEHLAMLLTSTLAINC